MNNLLIVLLISNLSLFAQIPEFLKNKNPEHLGHNHHYSITDGLACVKNFHKGKYVTNELFDFEEITKREYDITSIELFLDWSEVLLESRTSRAWSGRANIEFDLLNPNLEFVELDAVGLRIDDIKLNNQNIKNIILQQDGLVYIPNNGMFNITNNKLEINYTRLDNQNSGFHIIKPQNGLPYTAFTQSQPNDARKWFPCNDNPYEKQISKIAIRVPKSDENGRPYVTASNGQLVDSIKNGNTATYFWEHDFLVPSYLMVANVSTYNFWVEKVARIENKQDSIHLTYYVWEEDMNGVRFNTDVKNETMWIVPRMMDTLSAYFGEYPFKKFGTVAVDGFPAGGMEHQSIQSIRRSWLDGEIGGFTHELAHMWLGDKVTCESWNDIWMNEGGAVFGTILFMEKDWSPEWRFVERQAAKDHYLGSGGLDLTPLYIQEQEFVFSGERIPVIYSKAGWVYLMLRNLIGEEDFYPILRDYYNEYAYGHANTEDMRNYFKDRTNKDIDTFFEQWVYGSGHPIYNVDIKLRENSSPNFATISLTQIQGEITNRNDCSDVFQVPLKILVKTNDTQDTVLVFNDQKNQTIEINSDKEITNLEIDDNFTLFQINQESILSIENENPSDLKIYPNVLESNSDLTLESSEIISKIEIFNLSGIKVFDKVLISNKLAFKPNLSPGKYFLRIHSSGLIETKTLIIN